jgi:hypothetical protein
MPDVLLVPGAELFTIVLLERSKQLKRLAVYPIPC